MSRQDVERAGLRYPPGDPEDFSAASRRLGRASADLQTVPGRIHRLTQLGAAWTGGAAERFRAGAARSLSSISDIASALRLAALAADLAGELAAGAAFSLEEQVRASRAAEEATQEAERAQRRADRAREHYQDVKRRAERELRQLEEDTRRADARARGMLEEVGHTLAAVVDPTTDPSADPGCPIGTPLFTAGAGVLPFLTHSEQLARNALRDPLHPARDLARNNAYSALAEGVRDAFPNVCVGPEPPTPPSDAPTPHPAPVRPAPEPADEPSWFERRWDDVKDLPGTVKDVAEGVPGAIEGGYHAYDRWTDDRLEDVGTWLQDNFPRHRTTPQGRVSRSRRHADSRHSPRRSSRKPAMSAWPANSQRAK